MKKSVIAALAATLLAAVSVPTFAQDATVNAGVSAAVSAELPSAEINTNTSAAATTEGTNANATGSAATSSDNSYASVIAGVSGSASVDLKSVTDEANVTIVLISSLEGDADGEGLDAALTANADATTKLRGDVEGNAAIKAKLVAGGYNSSDVVAVTSSASGSITVYVDDRA